MAAVRTPKQLYRFLLRRASLLPEDAQEYYKHRIRQARLGSYGLETLERTVRVSSPDLISLQEFASHADESDSERVQQIIERAILDSKWVLDKVSIR